MSAAQYLLARAAELVAKTAPFVPSETQRHLRRVIGALADAQRSLDDKGPE